MDAIMDTNMQRNVTFHKVIRFKIETVHFAHEIAACNFKVMKSIEYLDLAMKRPLLYSIRKLPVNYILTQEDMRKWFNPDRYILYKYHVDLPVDLENCSCKYKTKNVRWDAFHMRKTSLHDNVFKSGLETGIVSLIENGRDRIHKLRCFIKIIKLLNFNRNEEVIYLYNRILQILFDENCTDRELVKDFVTMLDFPLWMSKRHTSTNMQHLLLYVLHHAKIGRYLDDLWRDSQGDIDVVNMCFYSGAVQNIPPLLQYGATSFIPSDFDFGFHSPLLLGDEFFERMLSHGFLPYHRIYRVFQLFYYFLCHFDFQYGLACIWRSIKEPFLCLAEIEFTLFQLRPRDTMLIVRYYEDCIDQVCRRRASPRSLKDLCRVEYRRLLKYNWQLPVEIAGRELSENMRRLLLYLNLEM